MQKHRICCVRKQGIEFILVSNALMNEIHFLTENIFPCNSSRCEQDSSYNTLNADTLNYFPTLSQSIIFARLTRTALMTSFEDVACTGLTKIYCNLAGQYCVTVQPDMSVST
ncbi:hypothetical protein T02_7855 [Trichinella nativa]|uniref:Uncharacterized protein n=1 Tax=Trichinella nativa TaxID=6335 RepID=A0A0V1LJ54_9BILA|nr:hypothetical protein T02_7855 [Trichinella nativa]